MSIREFQQGLAGYVIDVVEQVLLLLADMANLKSIRKQEVFLSLKRDLAMVSPSTNSFFFFFFLLCFFFPQAIEATFRAKEMVNFSYKQMKEKEGRCIAAMEAFNMADKRITDLKNKLTEAERNKKSAEAALEGAERQAEGQQRQLRQTEDQLSTSKEHIAVLKKKLEEDEKARDQAE